MQFDVPVSHTVKVNVTKMKILLKIRNEFNCNLLNDDDKVVATYDGYVPSFVPGRYGEYLDFVIDVRTGQILNWPSQTKFVTELKEYFDVEKEGLEIKV